MAREGYVYHLMYSNVGPQNQSTATRQRSILGYLKYSKRSDLAEIEGGFLGRSWSYLEDTEEVRGVFESLTYFQGSSDSIYIVSSCKEITMSLST